MFWAGVGAGAGAGAGAGLTAGGGGGAGAGAGAALGGGAGAGAARRACGERGCEPPLPSVVTLTEHDAVRIKAKSPVNLRRLISLSSSSRSAARHPIIPNTLVRSHPLDARPESVDVRRANGWYSAPQPQGSADSVGLSRFSEQRTPTPNTRTNGWHKRVTAFRGLARSPPPAPEPQESCRCGTLAGTRFYMGQREDRGFLGRRRDSGDETSS